MPARNVRPSKRQPGLFVVSTRHDIDHWKRSVHAVFGGHVEKRSVLVPCVGKYFWSCFRLIPEHVSTVRTGNVFRGDWFVDAVHGCLLPGGQLLPGRLVVNHNLSGRFVLYRERIGAHPVPGWRVLRDRVCVGLGHGHLRARVLLRGRLVERDGGPVPGGLVLRRHSEVRRARVGSELNA